MPTFNRPQLLQQALGRIVAQTYQNLEIIVSDNASPTDEVDTIVRGFMATDLRIKYFRQPFNYGPAHNFQFVLDQASGDFFMWAADDDWRAETYVAELVDALTCNPGASLAFCNFIAADTDGKKVSGYPDFLKKMLPFTHRSKILRQLRFFLQNERFGKANSFYGLIRRQHLQGFKFDEFGKKAGLYGVDMLFVFWLLGKGSLALSSNELYKSTVGNQKFYEVSAAETNSMTLRITRLLASIKQSLDYSLRYLLLADSGSRLTVALFLPVKLLQTCWMLIIPTILSRWSSATDENKKKNLCSK